MQLNKAGYFLKITLLSFGTWYTKIIDQSDTMYVIVSFLEGITGFYEQNSKSKSKTDIPEMDISLLWDVAIKVIREIRNRFVEL